MLFITRLIQNIITPVRVFFGPLTSFVMRARMYMRPGQAIRNQFRGVSDRFQMLRTRIGGLGNSIIPKSWRKRLGLESKSKRIGKDGKPVEGEFGELDAKKARRLSGGRKLNVLQKQAQFSQVHLIDERTGQRQIAHIGQKVDRAWTEMILPIGESESVRLTYTMVDTDEYGADVVVTYERGVAEIFVDNKPLTHNISLPIRNNSLISIAGVRYTVDMFAYEALPIITRVDASWVTTVGPVRDDNQDAIGLYQHHDGYMFIIADGVGGGYAGDVVSEYAVKYMLKVFQKNIRHNLSWYDIYLKAFRHVNAEVRKFVERSPYPAGTTLTSVVIRHWTAHIAHVGDSRVYHMRGTRIKQLTADHREQHRVERTKQYEHIPDEYLPMRDVLVKAIGKRDDIDPQIITMPVQPGDKLLMITDGVTHQVTDNELYQIMVTEDIDDAPVHMVSLANERENTDNASAILIHVMEDAYEQDIWRAVAEDRIYIGGKNWRLDLSRPHEMHTTYEVPNQVGCVAVIILLLTCGLLWWLPQQLSSGTPPATSAVVESISIDGTQQSNPTTVPTEVVVTVATEISVATELDNNTVEATEVVPTAVIATQTATQIPPPTNTLLPTNTPLPTTTPVPTLPPTITATATPIPPTSTLRA